MTRTDRLAFQGSWFLPSGTVISSRASPVPAPSTATAPSPTGSTIFQPRPSSASSKSSEEKARAAWPVAATGWSRVATSRSVRTAPPRAATWRGRPGVNAVRGGVRGHAPHRPPLAVRASERLAAPPRRRRRTVQVPRYAAAASRRTDSGRSARAMALSDSTTTASAVRSACSSLGRTTGRRRAIVTLPWQRRRVVDATEEQPLGDLVPLAQEGQLDEQRDVGGDVRLHQRRPQQHVTADDAEAGVAEREVAGEGPQPLDRVGLAQVQLVVVLAHHRPVAVDDRRAGVGDDHVRVGVEHLEAAAR